MRISIANCKYVSQGIEWAFLGGSTFSITMLGWQSTFAFILFGSHTYLGYAAHES